MNIDVLHSTLVSLLVLPEHLRAARKDLPAADGALPLGFGALLGGIERDLHRAKVTLARELGFPICRCCWPPQLLATDLDGQSCCPATLQKEAESPLAATAHEASANANRTNGNERQETGSNFSARKADSPKQSEQPRLNAFARSQKERLLQLRDAIIDSITDSAKVNLRDGAGSGADAVREDAADAGSDAFDRDLALSLLAQERDALFEIDAALRRIEAGSYGICEMCGRPIPHARLEAIPFARLTVECQAGLEKEQKAHRVRQSFTSAFEAERGAEGEGAESEDDEAADDRERAATKRSLVLT